MDVLQTLERMVDEEELTPVRWWEKIGMQLPGDTLIRTARASRMDTAVAAWANQVRTLADNVVEGARHVTDDQSMVYTLVEVDKELQLLGKQGQQLQELLATGVAAGYAGHPQFKEVQKAVLGEVPAQVEAAESWLEKVRGDLMAVNPARRTRPLHTWPAGASPPQQVSVYFSVLVLELFSRYFYPYNNNHPESQ
jgi:hypothetical protein